MYGQNKRNPEIFKNWFRKKCKIKTILVLDFLNSKSVLNKFNIFMKYIFSLKRIIFIIVKLFVSCCMIMQNMQIQSFKVLIHSLYLPQVCIKTFLKKKNHPFLRTICSLACNSRQYGTGGRWWADRNHQGLFMNIIFNK